MAVESKLSRREKIREYKERKPPVGAFAIRCSPTGQAWVGTFRNLDVVRNSAWFALRLGNHPNKSLQAEWNAHGEPNFEYQILEELPADTSPLEVTDLLKKMRANWIERLGAHAF